MVVDNGWSDIAFLETLQYIRLLEESVAHVTREVQIGLQGSLLLFKLSATELEGQVLQVVNVVLKAKQRVAQLRRVCREVRHLYFIPALLHLENYTTHLRVEMILRLVVGPTQVLD